MDCSLDPRHYLILRSCFSVLTSLGASPTSWVNLRFFFDGLCSRLWLRIVGRRRILLVPVTLNRFFAALRVFCFGISFHSCVFRRAQHHHHVAAVEERLGLDHPDVLHLVCEPEEQIA